MKEKAIPEGFHSLIPSLVVRDAEVAIAFYMQVFDAKRRRVFHVADGKIGYAELQIGDSILMLSDEFPEMKIFSPELPEGNTSFSLFLYVEDVDTVFEKAVSAGAKIIMPLSDAFWGDRAGGIVDPFGHHWLLATHIKDISDEELEKATRMMFAKD